MSTRIPLDKLVVSSQNVRKTLDKGEDTKDDTSKEKKTKEKNIKEETDLGTLTSNINQYGLLNPLTVCKSFKHPGKYDILAGQRRFRAVKTLGWSDVPCNVVECKSDTQAELISLAENIQRLPMTVQDKCATFQRLFELHNQDIDEVSKVTNLSVSTLRRYLNLSSGLTDKLHSQLDEKGEGKLTMDVANLLTKTIEDKDEQEKVYEKLKDISSNREKKKVLEALKEDPDVDIDELIEGVKSQEKAKKKMNKIRNKPWIFDENNEPLQIPKKCYRRTLEVVRRG